MKGRQGVTLVELVISTAIGLIAIFVIGSLLVAGQRNWNTTYNTVNNGVNVDADISQIVFGIYGRQSNRASYCLYQDLIPVPSPGAGAVVSGNAVEFRYWDQPLSAAMLDPTVKATAYVLIYLDKTTNTLKANFGPYPQGGPGGVSNGKINTPTRSEVLAHNVTSIQFSHTTINTTAGLGNGSVRMVLTMQDNTVLPTVSLTVKTATMMRNYW
jgi:hypothetical protein